ncbi:hypothetical protein DPEC_G00244670 [Dallia pectoralis]|uniref:Uncharacterized protein n=1 Tax=Dallia pectoralis TaxID=75939 RepID=A0ACC2FVX1_DALPE|nr:hypothetical protein DPEC_G00244670 [Dallia pectoralis]
MRFSRHEQLRGSREYLRTLSKDRDSGKPSRDRRDRAHQRVKVVAMVMARSSGCLQHHTVFSSRVMCGRSPCKNVTAHMVSVLPAAQSSHPHPPHPHTPPKPCDTPQPKFHSSSSQGVVSLPCEREKARLAEMSWGAPRSRCAASVRPLQLRHCIADGAMIQC